VQDVKQKNMDIIVPRPILDNFAKLSSVKELQRNTVKEIVTHKNIRYVITGYTASFYDGTISCSAKKIIFLDEYKGEIKPVSYDQCLIEVQLNRRERGYNGQLITYNGQKYVTVPGETITFKTDESGTQTELF